MRSLLDLTEYQGNILSIVLSLSQHFNGGTTHGNEEKSY